jgi:hypothetical protein
MSSSQEASRQRELLTQRANTVRARMLRRIDLLRARRKALGGALHEARIEGKHVLPAVAVVALASATAVGLFLRARAVRRRRGQFWRSPTRQSEARGGGIVTRSVQSLAVSFLTRLLKLAAQEAAHRWLAAPARAPHALPERAPERLA